MDQPLWTPSPERVAATNLAAFTARARALSGRALPDYAALHAWSVEQPGAFWELVWDVAGIIGDKGGHVLAEGERMPGARWFPEARLNFAENLLEGSVNPQALVFWGEDKVKRSLSRAELRTEVARFAFPRQAKEGGLSIADFFRPVESGERDVIGLQVVTMGKRATEVAAEWFQQNKYQDYLYLHGLSVEMAEAMAEYTHKRIRAELGFAAEDAVETDKLLKQEYRGSRYSFGYPACPNLEDQKQLLALLGAERIGVTLSDEFQLEPEQSTSAIVALHPQAKYFSV